MRRPCLSLASPPQLWPRAQDAGRFVGIAAPSLKALGRQRQKQTSVSDRRALRRASRPWAFSPVHPAAHQSGRSRRIGRRPSWRSLWLRVDRASRDHGTVTHVRSVAPGQHQVSVPPTGCGDVAPPPGDHRRPIDALWQARPRAAYILTPGLQSSLGPFANPGGNRNLPNMEVCRDPRLYRCGPLVAAFAGHDAAQTAEFHPPSIPPRGPD
jgi:hypothetical protein